MTAKKKRPYTEQQYRRFKRLVEMTESCDQMDRINARLEMPRFIEQVGRETCDLMFARLCAKDERGRK